MSDPDHKTECERYGGGLSVRRAFVTLIRQGKIPEGKGPFLTSEQLSKFVHEAVEKLPPTTQIIIHELTWNDELWTECGRERIEIDKLLDTVDASCMP